MTVVLDASAILAWSFGEPCADSVEEQFRDSLVPAPNWAEVLQKVRARGEDLDLIGGAIAGFGVTVVPVDRRDATVAALLWSPAANLSLADRFCIAVGRRLDLPIWTCDRDWADVDPRVVVLR